jgi:HlyD family secretion protein
MRTIALLLLAALTGACNSNEDPSLITASGYIEATEVRVATKIGGTLERFPYCEGDPVEAGAELARIDTVNLQLQLDTVHAELDLARAELRLRQAGYRDEEIAEARAHLQRNEAELAAAQRELDRFQGLLDSGSGTGKSRDDALTRRDIAAKSVQAAEQRLRKLEAGFRDEEIAAATARVKSAVARIAVLEQQISEAVVTSPVAGLVTDTTVEEGELVGAGTLLAVVTNLTDVRLIAYVGEPDLGRIRLGQAAEVVTDGDDSRTGRLTYISSKAEFTPKNVQTRDERVKLVYKIKIGLDNQDGLFKVGMPAEVRLQAVEAGSTSQPES